VSELIDQMREALRSRHYSRRTEQAYCLWVRRFTYFHGNRHPATLAEPEINAFLTHLAVTEKVSASTQTQALSALLFLYRNILGQPVGELGELIRAKESKRLPVVLTREEVRLCWRSSRRQVADGLADVRRRLRLMECLRCASMMSISPATRSSCATARAQDA